MNRLVRLITALFLFLGIFANRAVAQVTNTNFFWGGGISNSWGAAANWSTTGRYVHTANYSSGSTTITIVIANLQGAAPSTILAVGHSIVGSGIPANTTVVGTITTPANGTTITLSQPTTAAGTAAVVQTYLRATILPFATTGTAASGTTATALIDNGAIGSPVISSSPTVSVVHIRNTFGPITGPILTISPTCILTVTSFNASPFQIAGGNIVNNGTLNITSNSTGASTGIACNTPFVPPTSGINEYGYSGSGTLNINVSASTTANSAAINVSSLNAFTTCKMFVNRSSTTFTLGSTANASAFRVTGGTAASPLIIGGTGVTLGSVGSPVRGGLLAVGGQSTVTINLGTTLELNSSSGNTTNGIALVSNTINVPTTFTNNGIINIFGESLASGISVATTVTATNQDVRINFLNGGTINVDLACITPSVANATTFTYSGEAAYKQSQSSFSGAAGIFFTNNGTVTLKNRSTVASTGYAIWGSGAGQRIPTSFTNNSTGVLNIEGSRNSLAQGFTLTNNGIVNSNNSITSFNAFSNNAGASINFGKTPAIFTVLGTAAATEGSTYTDGSLNVYTIRTTKVNGVVLELLAETAPIAAVPASGTLTLAGGTGDATIDYSAVTGITTTAISSNTTNSGTISTAQGGGFALNIISSTSFTLPSTSVLDPGGSSGKGITNISNGSVTVPVMGKLRLQVAGSAFAGVDYDQITNSASNGGFDISAATLEITSLYTPTSNAVIPIVVASGSGTIVGTFVSVTGLTSGWTISYASPTAVILIYTVVVIPTIWTGVAADNNFFTEANWKDSITNAVPAANTINPGANINLHLQINSVAATIASGAIQLGTGSLTISSANLTAASLSGGTVKINEGGYLELSSSTPFLNNVQMNFTSGIGWVRTTNYNPTSISANNLGLIRVNSAAAVYQINLRLDQYYEKGCVIRANVASTTPLMVFDGINRGGSSGLITVNTIHSDTAIANALNNKIESFVLKKGFMVTFANEIDGTGKSINYIASENDLTINSLPRTLQNSISFIRVIPWNWVAKKGRNVVSDLAVNTTWRYQWNPNDPSTLEHEFAPMAWGNSSADDATDIAKLIAKYNCTHIMSFNEPDNCFDQSGQYGNPKLCVIDQAVKLHKNLMKTGMRIVSPGGREEAPFGWLQQFYDAAKAQDVRIDAIAVHWYDWGNNPAVNTNPTGDQVFDRFKTYLTNVYNRYGLPIWITEFNANPYRSQAVNARFLELALPYLESLPYIERYCWFPFNTGTHFSAWDDVTNTETNKVLVPVGTIYLNINNTTPTQSNPSIGTATTAGINSLNLDEYPNIALNKPATASSSFSTYVPAYAVDGDNTNTNSRWLADFSAVPLPAWLEVDLQGSFLVDSFRIFEDSNFGGKPSKDFTFQIWDASLNAGVGGWVNALTVTGNPATSFTTYKILTPVSTTKVRLFITGHNNTTGYIRIFELEVYGTPSSPVWTGNTSTSWTTASNWSTRAVPNELSNVTIASGRPFQPTISTSQSMKTLTIDSGAALSVNSGINLTVSDAIRNSGTMTIANNSNLLQGEAFNNSGNIIITRNSNPLSLLDYTIWSSPVTNSSQFLTTFSPFTLLNRFYNYNELTNQFNEVVNPSTTPFGLGNGYLIRMPNNSVVAPLTQIFSGIFTGVPNTSAIEKAVTYKGTTYGYNMIGNPYPSTIDADQFINSNSGRIEPYLYFRRKKNGDAGSAYAVYGLLGGTATATSGIPNGKIQVGQGFFVKVKRAGTVSFTNYMRIADDTNQTFKIRKTEKDRLWLNLTNTSGVFSQLLIGYVNDASKSIDQFDSKYINDSPIALTSNIENEEYTIQGRPVFEVNDVVNLNFKTNTPGDYTITLGHFEGVFAKGQDIYLLDSKTGIETNLKTASYTFTAAAEIDNTRFSLKYQKNLNRERTTLDENTIVVYKQKGILYINSSEVALTNVKVYNLQGRLIIEQKDLNTTFTTIKDLKAVNQILIIKMTRADNSVVTKKVLK